MKLDRDNLVENLQRLKLQIVFAKADGSLRSLFCTLREDCLPDEIKQKKTAKKKKNAETLLSVWDLEKKAWRSFHCDQIAAVLQMESEDAPSEKE